MWVSGRWGGHFLVDMSKRAYCSSGATLGGKRNAWLNRQSSDPYVRQARMDGFRSRAAFKLLEINQKHKILRPGQRVLDLGAAPGGWSQVASKLLMPEDRSRRGGDMVVAVDLLPFEPLDGVKPIVGDFRSEKVQKEIIETLGTKSAEVILSDMAPALSGNRMRDHLLSVELCESLLGFVEETSSQPNFIVMKVLEGAESQQLAERIRGMGFKLRRMKPKSSRKESREYFLIASTV